MKKYELTSETKVINGVEVHRIKALKSFGNIKEGDLGGWIESEKNLSQDGNAWIFDNATVYDNARVGGDAKVRDNARVGDNAKVRDNAWVGENAWVNGDALVGGDAWVNGNSLVGGNAEVRDNAWVGDNAWVNGNSLVGGNAEVYGNSWVGYNAKVGGNVNVRDNARIGGDAKVYGNATISWDATVRGKEDYIVFKNWWSSGRYFTWTRSNNKWAVGCFYGSGEELIAKAYKDSVKSGLEYERVVKYVNDILKEDNDNGNRNKCEG